ncbi:hypothetical protein JCM8547_000173 [Rhodosporidiobolus lusitaniae]
MLRLSSYGSSARQETNSHGYLKSPAAPASHRPSVAFPVSGIKPSDVLVNRSHELKRLGKHLAEWFSSIATAHHNHSLALSALSAPSKTPLTTPLQEASLFLPLNTASAGVSSLGGSGSGREGWAQILHEAKETNLRVAEAHADLAKRVNKEVVGPLSKVRVEMKSFIALMERDVNKGVDVVQKERDITGPLLIRLSASLIALPSARLPSEDPVLLRALIETQLAKQLEKENDLLAVVKTWTGKVEEKEREVFEEIKRCWAVWEGVSSATHLNAQQHSMFLSATVDSLPSDAEWAHFVKLNHSVHPDTPGRTLAEVGYEGRGDPLTGVVMEGLLERQTSFLRSWKPAYFLLTPSGHLHVYPPPPASTSTSSSTPPSPSGAADSSVPSSPVLLSDSNPSGSPLPPLTPSALHLLLHSTPLLSLALRTCTLGPMPVPEHSEDGSGAPAKKKEKALEPVFTLVENGGTKHVIRCGGGAKDQGDGWEEMGRWVGAIGPFTAPPTHPPSPVLSPSASARSSTASLQPPSLPARSVPLGQSPALPSLPTSPASETPPPPPLPPRELLNAQASAAQGGEEDLEVLPLSNGIRSSLVISESGDSFSHLPQHADQDHSYRDSVLSYAASSPPTSPSTERRLMDGLGVVGSGAGLGFASSREGGAPPVPPRDNEKPRAEESEDEEEDEEDEDAGDLGRSIRPSHSKLQSSFSPASASKAGGQGMTRSQSGSVRSLAAAWEQNASPTLGAASALRSPPLASPRTVESPKEEVKDLDEVEESKDEPVEREIKLDNSPVLSSQQVQESQEQHQQDEDEKQGEETPSEPATPKQSGGKKGKKKRKSKGGTAKPLASGERPLPLPSVDPEHADLGLPSPMSPAFDLSVPDSASIKDGEEDPFELERDVPAEEKEEEEGTREPFELDEAVEHPSTDKEEDRKEEGK